MAQVLSLILSLFIAVNQGTRYIPMAHAADGSDTDQLVSYNSTLDIILEEFLNVDTLSHKVYDVKFFAQRILVSDFNSSVQVYQVEVYAGDTGSPPNPLNVSLCPDVASDPDEENPIASALITTTGDQIWINATFTNSGIIEGASYFWIVFRTVGGDSSNYYFLKYEGAGDEYAGRVEYSGDSGGSWSQYSDDFPFKVWVHGADQNTTTGYAYYWDDLHQYNFTGAHPPAGTDKILNCTYPQSQRVLNITKPATGVLTSSEYTDALYNGSHRRVSLPEATIDSYGGGPYSLFTETHAEYYTLEGLTYENGTQAGSVSVTAFDDTGDHTFILDEIYIFNGSSVDNFNWDTWDLATPRRIELLPTEINGSLEILTGTDTMATYTITVYDYTGYMFAGWLECYRYIGGSQTLTERRIYSAANNDHPYNLEIGATYKFQFRSGNGITIDLGTFIAGASSTTFSLTKVIFSRQAHINYKYLTVEATRNSTFEKLTVNYNDTRQDSETSYLDLEIRYRNGTVAYATNSTGPLNTHQFQYTGDNETDYWVYLEITHDFHGSVTYQKILGGALGFSSFPSLEALGTWGGLVAANLLPIIMILFVGYGGYTAGGSGAAMFTGMSIASFFKYIDAVTWSNNLLYLGWLLVIVYAIVERGR